MFDPQALIRAAQKLQELIAIKAMTPLDLPEMIRLGLDPEVVHIWEMMVELGFFDK